MSDAKKTPLFEEHVKNGGKMVPFAGWWMPVQFAGIREEHEQVRNGVGLFDVSHMGEIRVSGPKALETLQWLTTNDVSRLKKGQAQYSLFPNPKGGVVDDLIVYCLKEGEDYLLCVNAANQEKDFQFLTQHNRGAQIVDESSSWGQIAVQGPKAIDGMEALTRLDLKALPSFHFIDWNYQGKSCLVARTGYTGEDGVEIFVPWDKTESLWQELMAKLPEAKPIGLGARDTLRTEMRYPLYGQELSDETNPYGAGLGWVVKPEKGDFLGKDPMLLAKDKLTEKLAGLKLIGPGIVRTGYKVFSVDNGEIGRVTSGTLSPSLNQAIAIAYLSTGAAKIGTRVLIEMRNKKVEAEVVRTPFYSKA